MFHLLAYTEDPGAAIADGQINALNDPVFTQRNNSFWLSSRFDVVAAAVMGATLDDARLEAPSLRLPTFPYLNINENVTPPSPLNVTDYRLSPFTLTPNEELQLSATDDAVAPGQITGLVAISPGLKTKPSGNIVRLQGVSTATATANAWSSIETVNWTNNLPHGEYALVGMEHFSANGQAARAIFTSPGVQILRPGCVSVTALGNITHPIFRVGNLGEWGRFTADDIPQIEVLCNGADSAHTVYLDIIKVR